MFSLKTTELKCSRIGIALWLLLAVVYAALLQIYWMPDFWRALLYLGAGLVGLLLLIRMFRQPSEQLGIDEHGAFILGREGYERLLFIRVNGVQLIAKVDKGKTLFRRVCPRYRVIYRDSLSGEEYKTLRSYAAQQILLRRSEEFKKHRSS